MTSPWKDWKEFKAAQQEVVLPAGAVTHIPVTIRYIDEGAAQRGTILLMPGIPIWGYLYHAVIPTLVEAGYRVIAHRLIFEQLLIGVKLPQTGHIVVPVRGRSVVGRSQSVDARSGSPVV